MPYTPPSQQSPASTRNSSPALSRNASYSHDHPPRSSGGSSPRPSLPRSVSSTAYLSKHRRSPSITKAVDIPTSLSVGDKAITAIHNERVIDPNGSLRQSPPPLNNLLIPTGVIISPPDSSENSDGDESAGRESRQRELDTSWGELQQAVRSMSLKRDPSPVKSEDTAKSHATISEPTSTVILPTTLNALALSPEARKIAHSRSSTETAIPVVQHSSARFSESPIQTSDDSENDNEDDEDDRPRGKPPLVRKKSGELVKPALRPSSRRRYSSMPGTPTYHKSVHFNDNGNQTRHFLQVDKPMAVSASTSPVESYENETEYPFEDTSSNKVEWDIKLTNFPEDTSERKLKPIWVERLFLSGDTKSLVGSVAVANISFHKTVVARFTLDYWKTTSEVLAEFSQDVRRKPSVDGYDRFTFTIRLADQANLENKTLLLCMRYNVIGQEHWDNNNNMNYQIDFVKRVGSKSSQHLPQSTLGARPLNAIPRSRHSPPATARGRAPSIDDDIVSRFDDASAYHFGSPESILDETTVNVKLKPRSKRGSIFPTSSPQPSNGLGGRYDFGASLTAALSSAQDKLGNKSGLMNGAGTNKSASSYFTQDASRDARPDPEASPDRPDAITTDRPAMGSAQYKDLVSKFCYFTPPAATSTGGKPSAQVAHTGRKAASSDGALDVETPPEYSQQSTSDPPSPPRSMSPLLDGTNEGRSTSSTLSLDVARSQSPTKARSAMSTRAVSPMSFGYPYQHTKRDGFFSDSHTPTAIQG